MPKGKTATETFQKTSRGAWFYIVISTVSSVALSSLAALGATAFLAWKDGNWDGLAILAISAVAVVAILVGTFVVLHQLSDSGGECVEEEDPREEGTRSA